MLVRTHLWGLLNELEAQVLERYASMDGLTLDQVAAMKNVPATEKEVMVGKDLITKTIVANWYTNFEKWMNDHIVKEGIAFMGNPETTFWQRIGELNQQHGNPWVFDRHIEWARTKIKDHSADALWSFAKESLVKKSV